jgi:hypothetical protein
MKSSRVSLLDFGSHALGGLSFAALLLGFTTFAVGILRADDTYLAGCTDAANTCKPLDDGEGGCTTTPVCNAGAACSCKSTTRGCRCANDN